jgi:hypothetical protein
VETDIYGENDHEITAVEFDAKIAEKIQSFYFLMIQSLTVSTVLYSLFRV